jgi:hypothetical protein
MANLTDFVKFDTSGWRLDGSVGDNPVVWLFPGGGGIGLYHSSGVPSDIPPNATMDQLLAHARSALNKIGGGLVEYEVAKFAGVPSIRSVVRVPTTAGLHGFTYLASLTIPFQQRSFLIKAQCSESGMTGIREAVVLDRAFRDGTIKPDGKFLGWVPGPHSANLSEDPSLDSEFSEHPLSRARAALRQVTGSLVLSSQLGPEPPFPLPLGN